MALLSRAAGVLASLVAGCTFNPEYEVSSIVCMVGDDNTCPSGFTCTLTEASPEGVCCKGTDGRCTEEPPALSGRGRGNAGESGEPDSGRGDAATAGKAGDAAGGAGGSSGAPGSGGSGTGGSGGAQPDASALDTNADLLAADASPDLPTTPTCVPACTVGHTRCGPGGGVRTCVLVAGCPAWGVEMSCGTGGRRTCTGAEPAARCECGAAPAGCNGQAGAFCGSASALETCVADADGCIYKGPTTTCPAAKPCTGTLPSASCSCGAAPAACMGASGNLCTSPTTLITCGSNAEGCPAVTAMKTCGASETCMGSAGSATCMCNPPPAACVGVGTGTVCSGNSVLGCGMTGNGCVTSSTVKSCTAGKPCSVMNGAADCRCGAFAPACAGATGTVCSGNDVLSCGTNSDGCTTSSTVKTCPAGKPCAGPGGSADCTCGPVASECAGMTGTVCQGTTTVLTCGTNADGCGTSSTLKTCTGNKQCGGSPADCRCVNEPSLTDCPAGMDGSRCVGAQVYTCGTAADGCRTLTKTSCSANGACVGTLPNAHCVTEVTFGNATDGMGADIPHAPGNLLGFAFQVTTTVTLKRFGLITENAPGQVNLALYSHNGLGGTMAAPANYLAGSLYQTTVTGKREYAVNHPPAANVTLTAGTTYWIMVAFEKSTLVAHGPDNQSAFFRSATYLWGDALPMPYPAAAPYYTGTPANFYIVGLPQ